MYQQIPKELREMPQWVCWQSVKDEARPGKIKKIPINARTGGQAQSNNPDTWCSFEEAVKAAPRHSGIGFMFANGIFGVDLDGCTNAIADYRNGIDDNIVGEFIHSLKSYAEYSISGEGIHILCKGVLPPGGRRKRNVEMYENARFFIMTGQACSPYKALRDCTKAIKPLHEKYIGGGQAPTTGIRPVLPANLSDAEIIKMARDSKQGQIFSDLWSGNFTPYYQSQSEADMTLANILAFWTGRDAQVMDRLFRQSGLMRPKWDRRQSGSTYGQITIAKAIRDCVNVYTPKSEYRVHIGTAAPDEEVPTEVIRSFTFDDTGNARRFISRFGHSVRYNYTAKKWMYYDGRRWATDDGGEAKRMADEVIEEARQGLDAYLDALSPEDDAEDARKAYLKHVRSMRSSRSKAAMLTEAQHQVEVRNHDFDNNAYLLSTLNGTINLTTGDLLPHDRDDMISKLAACEYTDKTDTPRWTTFLNEIFEDDQDLVRFVQKAVGYSMTGSTEEHCAFFCYGTGRNGKSTFVDVVTDMLGDYAVNIQPETIMVRQAQAGPTSDIARLKGARFVTTVEPNEGARLNEGLIKQLTGGDKVTASKKYEDEFEFKPEFKLWMATNHKPVIRGTDLGIWSRIRLIPFKVQIPDEKIDRQLKFKLREEMPGILAWAVEGCLLWRREGLKQPQSVLEASREYRGEMDVLSAFIDACCMEGGETDAGDLFRAYIEWAKESNEFEMSSTRFGREMGKKYEKRRSSRTNIYEGISLQERAGYGSSIRVMN